MELSTALSNANFGPMSEPPSCTIQCAGSFNADTGLYSLDFANDKFCFALEELTKDDIKDIASCLALLMESDLDAAESVGEVA